MIENCKVDEATAGVGIQFKNPTNVCPTTGFVYSEESIASEETTFEVGDVVQLKSGGPRMTVAYLASDRDYVTCLWHGTNTELFRKQFETCVLRKMPAENPRYYGRGLL